MNSAGTLTVAVDIGGTFTDVTLTDRASGRMWRQDAELTRGPVPRLSQRHPSATG